MGSGAEMCQRIKDNKKKIEEEIEKHRIGAEATVAIAQTLLSLIPGMSYAYLASEIVQGALDEAIIPEPVQTEIIQTINENISQERRQYIQNTCNQASNLSQTNIIDNEKCVACNGGKIYDRNGKLVLKPDGKPVRLSADMVLQTTGGNPEEFCKNENIEQTNKSTVKNNCIINNVIVDLMKAQDNEQAQVVAQVLQSAHDVLTQEQSEDFICQDVSPNVSEIDYLRQINTCAEQANLEQINILNWCGPAINVLQNNVSNHMKECIKNTTVEKETVTETSAKVDATLNKNGKNKEDENNKPSEGNLDSSILLYILIFVIICITLVSLMSVFYMFQSSNKLN